MKPVQIQPYTRYIVPETADNQAETRILDAFMQLAEIAHELSNKSGMQMTLFVHLLQQSRIHDCREAQEAIQLGYECVEFTRHLMADIYALHAEVVRMSLNRCVQHLIRDRQTQTLTRCPTPNPAGAVTRFSNET